MRLLVTGVRGFIGSGVACSALAGGHEVIGVDFSSAGRDLPAGVHVIDGDITRPAAWLAAFEGVDAVVHCAAMHRPGEIREGPARSIEVNLQGTRLMLAAAVDSGVRRFVHLSSAKAYGEPLGFPSSEDDLLNPVEPYGLAKALTENYCCYFEARSDMRCVSVRPFSAYGPGQDLATGYIGQILDAWMSCRPVLLSGDPHFLRDFVYIDDVVEVCLAAALEDLPFNVVNVGSGRATSLNDLVALMASLSGDNLDVGFTPAPKGTIERTLADVSRQTELLKRRPTPMVTGLRTTLESFRSPRTPYA